MSKRRVVVTGLGILNPVGNDIKTSWDNICNGVSGVSVNEDLKSNRVFLDGYSRCAIISGSVKNFDVTQYIKESDAKRMDIFLHFAIAAAQEAVEDSGLHSCEKLDRTRVGTAIGSGIGGLPGIEGTFGHYLGIDITKDHARKSKVTGPRSVNPFFIPGHIINMAPGHVSINYGFQGPSISVVSACTTGSHNIGLAARSIAYGDADAMVVGGTEMATSELGLVGFGNMRALAKGAAHPDDPTKASRPWDKNRDGFVLGDGAGILVLEELEHAKSRGAKIYGELVGFGMSADANHMTSPEENGDGAIRSMQSALNDAGLKPSDIDYINAHATSTPVGDAIEAKALKTLFGDTDVSISSTKSMTGHLLGAAGAIEAIFSVLASQNDIVPPTINLDDPCDETSGLDLVPNKAKKRTVRYALSNSFGFGGTNATLIFKKFEGQSSSS